MSTQPMKLILIGVQFPIKASQVPKMDNQVRAVLMYVNKQIEKISLKKLGQLSRLTNCHFDRSVVID